MINAAGIVVIWLPGEQQIGQPIVPLPGILCEVPVEGDPMPTYAVTGASGHFGRRVVEELLARGIRGAEIVAVARTPAKAADLAGRGVQLRVADYSRSETLPAALAGVQRLLLISGSELGQRVPQHTAVILAAKDAGAERILYTSILNADTTTNPLGGEHRGTETALRTSAVPFTLLRDGWYTENYTDRLVQYLERSEILGATGSGKVSGAPRADYAVAAAAAMLAEEDGDVIYELGGSAFSYEELAATISGVTGKTVVYRDLTPSDYMAALQQVGLDEPTAEFVAAMDASVAAGDLETDREDLARLLGRPPTPLEDAVRAAFGDHAAHNRPHPDRT
jgi:NAD(P)H dehydrogenase (quinone)